MERVSESLNSKLTDIAANGGTVIIRCIDYFVQFSATKDKAQIVVDIIWNTNYDMDENAIQEISSQKFKKRKKGSFQKTYTDTSTKNNVKKIITEIEEIFKKISKKYYKGKEATFNLDDCFAYYNVKMHNTRKLIWGILKLIIATIIIILLLYECGYFIYEHFK